MTRIVHLRFRTMRSHWRRSIWSSRSATPAPPSSTIALDVASAVVGRRGPGRGASGWESRKSFTRSPMERIDRLDEISKRGIPEEYAPGRAVHHDEVVVHDRGVLDLAVADLFDVEHLGRALARAVGTEKHDVVHVAQVALAPRDGERLQQCRGATQRVNAGLLYRALDRDALAREFADEKAHLRVLEIVARETLGDHHLRFLRREAGDVDRTDERKRYLAARVHPDGAREQVDAEHLDLEQVVGADAVILEDAARDERGNGGRGDRRDHRLGSYREPLRELQLGAGSLCNRPQRRPCGQCADESNHGPGCRHNWSRPCNASV